MTQLTAGFLADQFQGIGGKRLAQVDTPQGSHQNEIGKTTSFAQFLGDAPRKGSAGNGFAAKFIWLPDESDQVITHSRSASWYDSRAGKAGRSPEWRLYYGRSNPVMQRCQPGDLLIVALRPDGSLLVIATPAGSTMFGQLPWLFGLSLEQMAEQAQTAEIAQISPDFQARAILDDLGISMTVSAPEHLQRMIKKFRGTFPSTTKFSEFARHVAGRTDARADPDHALLSWFEQEDLLFRALEQSIVSKRIEQGFMRDGIADVDGFLKYSLSVQNRRKSRAGAGFANQVAAVLHANELLFEREVRTEGRKTIDFFFPRGSLYHDQGFPTRYLTGLGAKTSCKDRWRQVLSEAHRLDLKYLVTLETKISDHQLEEMSTNGLQLVIPRARHWDFSGTTAERKPVTLVDFIAETRAKQVPDLL
jgi:EcoRII C terminal